MIESFEFTDEYFVFIFGTFHRMLSGCKSTVIWKNNLNEITHLYKWKYCKLAFDSYIVSKYWISRNWQMNVDFCPHFHVYAKFRTTIFLIKWTKLHIIVILWGYVILVFDSVIILWIISVVKNSIEFITQGIINSIIMINIDLEFGEK